MAAIDSSIETPCIGLCVLDPQRGLCTGCGRSLEEIAGWIGFTAAERTRILAALPARRNAAAGAAGAWPAAAAA